MGGFATREQELICVVKEGGTLNFCGQWGWRHKCLLSPPLVLSISVDCIL